MLPPAELDSALKWYAALLLVGIPGWLLIWNRAKVLPDGGYGLGKVVGLLTLASVTWVLSIAKLVPFTQTAIWILTASMWSAVIYRRNDLIPLVKKHWKSIVIMELACIVLFAIGITLRASKPQIEGIEKFMDSGILNSLLRTREGPPLDPWYGGKILNYYYFGHWIVALIAKMTATPGWIAFNLGFATVVSVAGSMLLTAGWTVTKKLIGGILVVFLALFASNVHPFIALVKGNKDYFFFTSGRFVDQRINEYPFYSMSLGDLHAHMLSLMLTTTLAVFAILHMLIDARKLRSNALIMGLLLGLMSATNAFDTLSCSVLVGLVLLARWYRTAKRPFIDLWKPALYCAVGGIIPIGIFLTHFEQPTGGLGILLFQIPALHIIWQFGIPFGLLALSALVLCAPSIMASAKASGKPKPPSHSKTPTVRLRIGTLIQNSSERNLLIAIFSVFALSLIIAPEFGFIKDLYFYVNKGYALANTEFKVWYTGWIALAIATGSAVTLALAALWRRQKFAGIAAGLVVLASLTILCAGIKKGLDTLKDTQPFSLNGITYMNRAESDRVKVVHWAAQTIKGQPQVLEAVGDSYSNYNWFSSYTGLPTIMGWRSHEFGWRYTKDIWPTIVARENAARQIYNSQSADELRQLVATEKISYIMVGPQELAAYTIHADVFKNAFGTPVFDSGTIDIFYTGSN